MTDERVLQTMDDLEYLVGWLRAHPGARYVLQPVAGAILCAVEDAFGRGVVVTQQPTAALALHDLVRQLLAIP